MSPKPLCGSRHGGATTPSSSLSNAALLFSCIGLSFEAEPNTSLFSPVSGATNLNQADCPSGFFADKSANYRARAQWTTRSLTTADGSGPLAEPKITKEADFVTCRAFSTIKSLPKEQLLC